MFISKAKLVLASGALALGIFAAGAGTAQAGDYGIGIYVGHKSGEVQHGKHYRPLPLGELDITSRRYGRVHRGYDDHPRHPRGFKRRHHQRVCTPHRAIDKAWSMGVNRPHIKRVGENRIVVAGRSHGHRANVVFARWSRHCEVIKTRGLRWY